MSLKDIMQGASISWLFSVVLYWTQGGVYGSMKSSDKKSRLEDLHEQEASGTWTRIDFITPLHLRGSGGCATDHEAQEGNHDLHEAYQKN